MKRRTAGCACRRRAAPCRTTPGEFAARVEALRQRLEAAQQRLAGVAKQQNGLLEALARNELEQQKERIGTYQIQARFALASIYDRAALGGGTVATPSEGATESQGELEVVPPDQAAAGRDAARRPTPPPSRPSVRHSGGAAEMRGAPCKRTTAASAIAALCAGVALNAAAAPKKKEKTIGELRARPVVVQPDQKVEASAARAMDNYRRFLELQKTDPQLRAEALRRLGDLNMEAGEGERMAGRGDHHRHAGRRGHQALHEPAQELIPTTRATTRCSTSSRAPTKPPASPKRRWRRSTKSCASIRKSPQMDEVQFRRGELLFSARDYRAAQDAYQYVVTQGRQGRRSCRRASTSTAGRCSSRA